MYDISDILQLQDDRIVLPLNLQFFADDGQGGEKTEPATQKKLEDARKEGQVAKSKEIASGLGLVSLFLILKFWSGTMGRQFLEMFRAIYGRIPEITDLTGGTGPSTMATQIFRFASIRTLIILLPIFIIGYLVAFLSDYIQVQWKPTAKPLQPKLSKLNPLNGFKRIFSVNSLVELVKSIVKIFLIGYVAYSYLVDRQNDILILYDVPLIQAIAFIGETVINLGLRISLLFMVVAAADFAYQKFKFAKDMRMTKQEVKEEFKNQEGNPEIKGRIRQKMREASQRRMMQALPQADVVITNPTHYAVAIKYDQDIAPAPFVIAKGQDYLALKIKEVAKEHSIEIVENKPLARMLYANVNIDDQVPPELYSAVADVLAYVYHVQGRI
ncbi:MAG: flagellar biosynthesis protein FlhB [Lachnospiraceae bacterium]|nr:flagellar biosynthesis protein FlhB [Lachnospiraceae bacterium]